MDRGTRDNGIRMHSVIPRVETDPEFGLSPEEARRRLENGYGNTAMESATKTVAQIVKDNVFTYFNLIFCVLAVCVILVGAFNELVFMPVIIINSAIGIIQELRSKKVTDRLSLISAPRATVIRGGEVRSILPDQTVRDDIVIFSAGDQVYADARVLDGVCQVNEALVTGEADEITKSTEDTLLSGSFLVSGQCRARLENVGADSFVSKLTNEAKRSTKRRRSEMINSLNKMLKVIGIIIIPLGVAMFWRQNHVLERTVQDSVTSTVAALIGMIPEGLLLLVSIALVVSIMRLAKKNTLVHEMGCIETLARVDVLCVDKTGTITENKMTVRDIVPLDEARYSEDDIRAIMSDYVGNMGADNDTMAALRRYFDGDVRRYAGVVMQFSSTTKYGGVSYGNGESYILGAPEMILRERYAEYQQTVEEYSAQGCRVLLLSRYGGDITRPLDTGMLAPVSLILLTNKIRPEAPGTFAFFRKQGVKIIVISGDNPITVSQVAQEAGIEGAERYVDANTLNTERKIKRAVGDYVVFGRVKPEQKRKLIKALKAAGHTVAMTGDGVNDILAMKSADCSVAMASGSEVASQVAQLVLMDSNFSAMPSVFMEGRRVINNIERSASLYLVKNIFSFILAIVTLAFTLTYPITPSQLSLTNITTIGIPSFFLALEFNADMVRGKFLRNVISRAMPAGLTDFIAVLGAILLSRVFGFTEDQLSTMTLIIIGSVGFMMLYSISRPMNLLRKALLIAMIVLFVLLFTLGELALPWLFSLTPITLKMGLVTLGIVVVAAGIMFVLTKVSDSVRRRG